MNARNPLLPTVGGAVACLAWAAVALARPVGIEPYFDCGSVIDPKPTSASKAAVMMDSVDPATMSGPWEWRGVPAEWCADAHRRNTAAGVGGVAAAALLPGAVAWWRRRRD